MGWLLSREVIVVLALVGGAASLLAIMMQRRGTGSPLVVRRTNRVSYLFMGLSVLLFIISGLRGPSA